MDGEIWLPQRVAGGHRFYAKLGLGMRRDEHRRWNEDRMPMCGRTGTAHAAAAAEYLEAVAGDGPTDRMSHDRNRR